MYGKWGKEKAVGTHPKFLKGCLSGTIPSNTTHSVYLIHLVVRENGMVGHQRF